MEVLKIPILCYHRVHSDNDPMTPKVVPGKYCGHVTESVFRKQMKWLAEEGFVTVTHLDIMRWIYKEIELPQRKIVAIDFDDGRLNVFENAFPIMHEYGFSATVFVISDLVSGKLPKLANFSAMNWEHLDQLKNAGWTIGGHTATHTPLTKLFNTDGGAEKVETELKKCQESVKENLGIIPLNFAYPTGDWNEQVELLVKKHYRTARLWQNDFKPTFNTQKTNPHRLSSINLNMLITEQKFNIILSIL